ncbi:DNA polymerase I [Ignicoccus islandicus DSM 13165]|uniref:DNA polymerase n=1 Tax=Ignicoccus islandicus DSM 13165 TaxID=940295 RepID=A0A0U3FNZ2_9CREN|nr:DNA-directed DNA polymerase I [Ignicoccus islandicus]ALU12047.1 DNA polymerase I [Ignicoccus islandicus DSM 13165]
MKKRKHRGPTLFDFIKSNNQENCRDKNSKKGLSKGSDVKKDSDGNGDKFSIGHNEVSGLLIGLKRNVETKHQEKARLNKNVTLTMLLNNNDESSGRNYSILTREMPDVIPGESYYLLQVTYDGNLGKAVLLMYDEKRHEIRKWVDTYGHKPYFLTDLEPQEVRRLGITKNSSFAGMDVIERYDLLNKKILRLTKIYTTDPLAVRELRDKVPRAWEAKIKYHDNYTYDLGLIPLLPYMVTKNGILPVPHKVSPEEIEKINEAFKGESDEFKKLAIAWIPIFEVPPPNVRVLAIDIEVFTPSLGRVPDATKAPYPITSVALASNDGMKKVLVLIRNNMKLTEEQIRKLSEQDIEIEFFDSERALVIELLRVIRKYPILLTYNGDNFDLQYIYNRALLLGIPENMIPIKKTSDYFTINHGIHIDLYKFYDINAIKTYAFGNKYKEVNLDAVASALLGEHKVSITKPISELEYDELVIYNFRDAKLTLQLFSFNSYLPWKLIVLISRISKLGVEEVTRKQISAWIKNLFFWEHRRRRYLIPNREDIIKLKGEVRSSATIKGKRYQGAFVFEPVVGVFFNVLVLDFASLYPTIIKKYNISYETVNEEGCTKYVEAPEVGHKICQEREGITALIVGLLRDYRVKIYKRKAKDKSLSDQMREWYNTVQAAMKVYINASYGVLGAESFELYCPPAAESITAFGRYAIRSTMRYTMEKGIPILYGDTDSMFLWSPSEEILKDIINWVQKEFGLEIEVDKVYRFVAFTGLKKNYIGVYPDGSIDVKGLLGKKRHTPQFLKEAFSNVIEMIKRIETPEDLVETRERIKDLVQQLYVNLRKQYYNLDEVAFHMQLTKGLNEYNKNVPQHVKAARMLLKFGVNVAPGDVISFVKVKGAEGVKPVQLAKLTELDLEKYYEAIDSTLSQILKAFSIDNSQLSGTSKLAAFLVK